MREDQPPRTSRLRVATKPHLTGAAERLIAGQRERSRDPVRRREWLVESVFAIALLAVAIGLPLAVRRAGAAGGPDRRRSSSRSPSSRASRSTSARATRSRRRSSSCPPCSCSIPPGRRSSSSPGSCSGTRVTRPATPTRRAGCSCRSETPGSPSARRSCCARSASHEPVWGRLADLPARAAQPVRRRHGHRRRSRPARARRPAAPAAAHDRPRVPRRPPAHADRLPRGVRLPATRRRRSCSCSRSRRCCASSPASAPPASTRRSSFSAAYRGTAFLLGEVIVADDEYTGEHSYGVIALSLEIAEDMGLSEDDRRLVEFGALLHDVGKIAVPKAIVNKAGPAQRGGVEDHAPAHRRRPAHAQQGRRQHDRGRRDRARLARALGRQRLPRRDRRRGRPAAGADRLGRRRVPRDHDDAPVPPRAVAGGGRQGAARLRRHAVRPRGRRRARARARAPRRRDAGGVLRAHRAARAARLHVVPDLDETERELDRAIEEQLRHLSERGGCAEAARRSRSAVRRRYNFAMAPADRGRVGPDLAPARPRARSRRSTSCPRGRCCCDAVRDDAGAIATSCFAYANARAGDAAGLPADELLGQRVLVSRCRRSRASSSRRSSPCCATASRCTRDGRLPRRVRRAPGVLGRLPDHRLAARRRAARRLRRRRRPRARPRRRAAATARCSAATSDWVSIADRDHRLVYVNAGRPADGRHRARTRTSRGRRSARSRRRGRARSCAARRSASRVRDGVWRGDLARLHRDGREIPVSQVIVARNRRGRARSTSTPRSRAT